MPDISLSVEAVDYISDTGYQVRAHRIMADALFTATNGIEVPYGCIVDTGAAFSVISYSLWNSNNIHWIGRGATLKRAPGVTPPIPLEWSGVPCQLGETEIYLIDDQTKVKVGPFLLIAKFASAPVQKHEVIALLGMSFIVDNSLRFLLDASGNVPMSQFVMP